MTRVLAALALLVLLVPVAPAQDENREPPMTVDRMGEIILALDPEAQRAGNRFQFTVADVPVLVISDSPTACGPSCRSARPRAWSPKI